MSTIHSTLPTTPSNSKRLGIPTWVLLVFFIFTIASVVWVSVRNSDTMRQNLTERSSRFLLGISNAYSSSLSNFFNARERSLILLSQSEALKPSASLEEKTQALRSFLQQQTFYESLILTDEKGNMITTTLPTQPAVNSMADKEWFKSARVRNAFFSPIYEDELPGASKDSYQLTVSLRLADSNGKVFGVLAGNISLETLVGTLPRSTIARVEETEEIYEPIIYDSNGTIIELDDPNKPEIDSSIGKALRENLFTEIRAVTYYDKHFETNDRVFYAFVPLSNARQWGAAALQHEYVVQRFTNDILTRNLLLIGLFVLVALPIAVLFNWQYSQSLDQLSRQAKALATGNYVTEMPSFRDRALQNLAGNFKQMSNALAERDKALFERSLTLQNTNAELALATEKAQSANQTKNEFLIMMSHELRTPLNSILGNSDLLMMGVAGELTPEQRTHIERVRNGGTHLLTLVTSLLDFTKLDRRQVFLDEQPFSIHTLFTEIKQEMNEFVEGRQLTLITQISPDLPARCKGDVAKIKQVAVNLLHNAIKFTERGQITVTARQNSAAEWSFSVADTGIGIPKDAQQFIFEPFRQISVSYARQYEGVGLGLAISQRLVELMGGKITVESQLGEGATFTVTLPLHINADEAAPKALPASV